MKCDLKLKTKENTNKTILNQSKNWDITQIFKIK